MYSTKEKRSQQLVKDKIANLDQPTEAQTKRDSDVKSPKSVNFSPDTNNQNDMLKQASQPKSIKSKKSKKSKSDNDGFNSSSSSEDYLQD